MDNAKLISIRESKRSFLPHLDTIFTGICIGFCILFCCSPFVTLCIAETESQPLVSEEAEAGTEERKLASEAQSYPLAKSCMPRTIYLKSRHFQPKSLGLANIEDLRRLVRSKQERLHVLVQLDSIPSRSGRAHLKQQGINLLSYVPDHTWIATIPAENHSKILEIPSVVWAEELSINDKLDPAIIRKQWGSWNLSMNGTAAIYVAIHKDEDLQTGRELVKACDGKVTGEVTGIHMLIAELPEKNIKGLAAEDAVQWIEPAAPPLTSANDGIRSQIRVDPIQMQPYMLFGTGVDVLVYDSGQVGDHLDFGSRLIHGDTDTVSKHSTVVAGVIGGSGYNSLFEGGSFFQWRGMAFDADLISFGTTYSGTGVIFYEDVPDIETDFAKAQNWYGADLANMSLSSNIYLNYPGQCDLMGNYGASAVLIDQIVAGNNSVVGISDKYIVVGAGGHERGYASSCGTYGTIPPPAAAKNPIHVGGSNTNNNTMYASSSWGPTDDGRVKPTVVSGACQTTGDFGITSTNNNPVNGYTVMCGTSMAAASVTGGIALMLEQYRHVYNTSGNFWPSTAKAILIHAAVDFGNPGPDYQWGFGLVDIQAAVDLIARKTFKQSSIDNSEVDVYYFRSTDTTGPITVTLAWDDPEATFNANPALVNNLDLELVAPDGTIWQPWLLNPVEPANNATRGKDSRNNQEQVQVFAADEDLTGIWEIRVTGTTVPQGPQSYSLVCNNTFSNNPPPTINPGLQLLLLLD